MMDVHATRRSHSQIAPMDSSKFLRVGPFFQSIHLTWKVVSFPDPNQDSYFGTTLTPPRGGRDRIIFRLTVELMAICWVT